MKEVDKRLTAEFRKVWKKLTKKEQDIIRAFSLAMAGMERM